MRLFVSLTPPLDARQSWFRSLAPLRLQRWPFRWLEPGAMHLTLHFLGEVDSERVHSIVPALDDVGTRHPPIELRLRGMGAFPSARRARILWIGVEPEPLLLALQRDVMTALGALGFAAETRAWSPHVTVARARKGCRGGVGVEDALPAAEIEAAVAVRTIDLMSSLPASDGARYARLHASPLRSA